MSRFGKDIAAFLQFKHAQGHAYVRCEFMLRSFDRFATARKRGKREFRLSYARG